MSEAMKIEPAELGGFIVHRVVQRGEYSPPLFAGSLTDCLEMMRSALAPKQTRPDVQLKRQDSASRWVDL